MCRLHGAAVDAKDSAFTVQLLHQWKVQAQKDSWRRVLYNDVSRNPVAQTPLASEPELDARLRIAAAADLDVFRRSDRWPSTVIPLTLELAGFDDPVSTSALALALTTLDDLILVAPPGMGKTTTLFQIAESALANGSASPIVVSLSDWSTDCLPLLESIVKRPAFRGLSEHDIRAVAEKPGVILLLDGWNELDSAARKRAATQVARLQAELPELSLLISTRRQALDVPIKGARINLLPLDQTQQLDIAKALRGVAGERTVEQAWRTPGLRDLVTIPLYLTTLLALPEGAPFPTTKEEVIRRFVAVHEERSYHAEALAGVTHGLHQRFLEELAAIATRSTNTTISEYAARKAASEAEAQLVAAGQIGERAQPSTVLESLVSHHVLMRAGDPAGYSFQHQQFQEWYASHVVERMMVALADVAAAIEAFKSAILNEPAWEEPILFACERLARGDTGQQDATATGILAAFEVDPMLAAEMIFRSTDAIWTRVGSQIQNAVSQWHSPGKVDRALRFMICSGRSEFIDQVWPLITHENDQVHLPALRAGRRFRPSVLGHNAAARIAALPSKVREHVLHEIAVNSGMDGLDLAAAIAKEDPNPKVKASVIRAFAFRSASRHISDVLRNANNETYDIIVSDVSVDEVAEQGIKDRLNAAHARKQTDGVSDYDRLYMVYSGRGDLSTELATIIAEMTIEKSQDPKRDLIYRMRNRYPRAIADGLLQRVRANRQLFYGAAELLASSDLKLDDDELLQIALSGAGRLNDRAEAAASVLGPQAVDGMIEALRRVRARLRDAGGNYDKAASDRYHELKYRIGYTPSASLIAAARKRSEKADHEEMAEIADLISSHPNGKNDRGRPLDAESLEAIRELAKNWGNRMLASGNASRWQLASIARLVSHAPSVEMLPLLTRLLDENLLRFRAFRREAIATGWREGTARNEAQNPLTSEYQSAFLAIHAPETATLMRDYLSDEHFGELAARVLLAQWIATNEPGDVDRNWARVDFSRVEEKRAIRTADPAATSPEADAIFAAIAPLMTDGTTDDQRKHAVALGIVGARLPHGQRDAVIQKLVSLAPLRARAALLQNLILSGDTVEIEIVKGGLDELFEMANTQKWILSDGYQLKDWLRLLPFVDRPIEALAIIRDLPDAQREPEVLGEMISAFGTAPTDDAEAILFQLAEVHPKLYTELAWRDAVMNRGSLSAARRFVDLVANGAVKSRGMDGSYLARQIGGLLVEHPEVRAYVYDLLKHGPISPGLALLADAVAEDPDTEGLLLLVGFRGTHISMHTIEQVVTAQIPDEDWKGSYNIVPISAVELRRKLLAMTTDGGPADAAARCLNEIDKIRDRYGAPESEPRHPDLASGKKWPTMTPDPDAH